MLERVRLVGGEELVELKFFCALVADRQRQRLGDEDAAGEYGEVAFLGIRLVARGGCCENSPKITINCPKSDQNRPKSDQKLLPDHRLDFSTNAACSEKVPVDRVPKGAR